MKKKENIIKDRIAKATAKSLLDLSEILSVWWCKGPLYEPKRPGKPRA